MTEENGTVNSLTDLQDLTYVHAVIKEQRLEGLLRNARLFQSDLARAVGVSPQAVCRWCAGDRSPRSQVALRLAPILRSLEHDDPTVLREISQPPRAATPLGLDDEQRKDRQDELERLRTLVAGYRIAHRRVLDYLDATSRDGLPTRIIPNGEEAL